MPRERVTIPIMPTVGLSNEGLQSRTVEQSLWQAVNAEVDLSGRLIKRRGLRQWGQTLKEPASGGLRWSELFSDLSHFDHPDGTSTANISRTVSNSSLIMETTGTGAGSESLRVRRVVQSNDGTADSTTQMSYRIFFRTHGVLPANPGAGNDYGPSIGIRNTLAGASDSTAIAFFADGIYVFNAGSFALIGNTDIDDSRWHVLELRFTQGLLTLLLDEVVRALDATVGEFASNITSASQVTFKARLNPSTKYAIEYDFVQARSTRTNPFSGVPVTNLFSWTSQNEKHLLSVAGSTIYTDTGHLGAHRSLDVTVREGLTEFVPYLGQLIILHPNLRPRFWGGTVVPVVLNDAPRTGLGTEHNGRLFVSGDIDHPLRIYFSGANNLDDWTTEEGGSFLTSGFFDIPDRRGEKVTALLGNFYGDLMAWTSSGSVWRITGNFVVLVPPDYAVLNINSTVGAVGPRAVERVSNDCLFESARGAHSLMTTDKSGSLEESFVSAAIRNRWQRDPHFGLARVRPNYLACVVHVPEEDRTYFGVQLDNEDGVNHAFVLNHATSQWSGPLSIPGGCMEYVQLAFPEIPCLMVGDEVGRIASMTNDQKADFSVPPANVSGGVAYSYGLHSAKLDGRSIDPGLSSNLKSWPELRIYVLPRTDHVFVIGRETDEWPILPEVVARYEVSRSQNAANRHGLTTSFVLNESRLADAEQVVVVTVPLDVVGRWMRFYVKQEGAAEDAVVLGFEVDFIPQRKVQENN